MGSDVLWWDEWKKGEGREAYSGPAGAGPRGGGPTGVSVPTVPRAWSLWKRVAARPRKGEAEAPGIVLIKLFLLPSFSPYPLPSQGTAEPSKK